MPKKRAKRRLELFDVYATNAGFHFGDFKGRFLCPICYRDFDRCAVQPDTLAVDLAHVYPESMGGKLETLTCKDCNSRIGTKYDSQLAIQKRAHDALKVGATRPVNARIKFQGGHAGIDLTRAGDGFHFHVVVKKTNPAVVPALFEALAKKGSEFQLSYKWGNPYRSDVAILHAAYLSLFRAYGYEYTRMETTNWIRETLLADDPPKTPNFSPSP